MAFWGIVVLVGYGDVHHSFLQSIAEADGFADGAVQGRDDLGPVGVIVHGGGIIVRVADHFTGIEDDGDPQGGVRAQLLTDRIQIVKSALSNLVAESFLE